MNVVYSLKNLVTKKLNSNQTRLMRNLVEPPFLYSKLSKQSALILGCQRSGTTLLFLILNSHPQIKGIDETETGYSFPHQNILYRNSIKDYLTCFKLPNQTFNFKYIKQHYPQTKIIFPIRNPYSVVSSMRSFMIETKNKQGNWLNCFAKEELLEIDADFLPDISALDIDSLDEISLGAYIWKYKNMALKKYQKLGFNVFTFKYEELLNNPQKVIREILYFLDLDWDNIVLNHQQYYKDDRKRYPGGTRGNRAINLANQKRKPNLSKGEIKSITSICHDSVIAYGYENLFA
jgi:protein-tyrosine sulfotransferase